MEPSVNPRQHASVWSALQTSPVASPRLLEAVDFSAWLVPSDSSLGSPPPTKAPLPADPSEFHFAAGPHQDHLAGPHTKRPQARADDEAETSEELRSDWAVPATLTADALPREGEQVELSIPSPPPGENDAAVQSSAADALPGGGDVSRRSEVEAAQTSVLAWSSGEPMDGHPLPSSAAVGTIESEPDSASVGTLDANSGRTNSASHWPGASESLVATPSPSAAVAVVDALATVPAGLTELELLQHRFTASGGVPRSANPDSPTTTRSTDPRPTASRRSRAARSGDRPRADAAGGTPKAAAAASQTTSATFDRQQNVPDVRSDLIDGDRPPTGPQHPRETAEHPPVFPWPVTQPGALSQPAMQSVLTDAATATETGAGRDALSGQGQPRTDAVVAERRDSMGGGATAEPSHSSSNIDVSRADRIRLIQRVARSFSRLGPEGGTVQLRLHPAELGTLSLQVRMEGRTLHARLTAQTEAAKEVLIDSLPQLRLRLSEQGFELSSFTVDVAHDGETPGNMSNRQEQSQHPPDRSTETLAHLRRAMQNRPATIISDQAGPRPRSASPLPWSGIDLQA